MIGKANISMPKGERLTVNVSGISSGFEITVQEVEVIDGYTVVEYIESTGSQYIDTGVLPTVATKAQMKFVYSVTGGHGIYGVCMDRSGSDSTDYRLFAVSNKLYLDIMTSRLSISYTAGSVNEYEIGNNYVKDIATGSSVMSGTAVSSVTTGQKIYIFNDCGTDAGRIYYLKMYDGDNIIRDYVPVKTDTGVYGLYDKVNKQFYGSASSTAFTGGAEIGDLTEAGAVIETSTSLTSNFLIPTGTTYMVSASDVTGYTTPSSQTFTAQSGTRTVEMEYLFAPTSGVFILDVNGKYWTTDEWDGSTTADCVAVFSESCKFGIALTEASSTMQIHSSSSGALENYMTAIEDESEAKADYDGATNTTNIMKLQSGTSYAAGWCNAYTFPSGKNGFLPSLGQMWTAYSNKNAVDAALTKAGGSAFTSDYSNYWTSTFWGLYGSDRECWILRWLDDYVSFSYLSANLRVRAFCLL